MRNAHNQFEFTGAIFKEGRQFVSLCLEVDVASQGHSVREAKSMLAEAVGLYLESCFESNTPYLRPVPKEVDPRLGLPKNLVTIFPLKVDFSVHAIA